MLLVLLFVLLLSRNSGNAVPLPLQTRALGMRAADNEPESRSMIEIIWGCVTTTFVCTWVSVHPNVPPRTKEEYGWKSLLRRLRLMFWALVAPELVLAWSAKQWYVAGKIADTYNHKKGMRAQSFWETARSYMKNSFRGKEDVQSQAWTRTHGHLVAMGGIVLIEPDNQTADSDKEEPAILTPEILEEFLKDPDFEINFTGQEIEDKAKGDFLSKSIVISQTTWFIMQCVARFVQKVAITELEVVTLALASLNAIMFFFWWSKPLGLTVPMKVNLCKKLNRKIESDKEAFRKFLAVFAEEYALRVFQIFWGHQGRPFFIRWIFFLLGYVLILLFLLVLSPIIFIAGSLYDVMASNSIPSGATHVPTFYSPRTSSEVVIFRIIFPIFGAVFGGLHCLGWAFTFPTKAEQKIWKLASITITIIPVLYFLTAYFSTLTTADGLSGTWKLRPFKKLLRGVAGIVAIFSVAVSWVYMLARITLLVEAVILLRKQPTTVFSVVDWTKFTPHIKF